MCLSLSLYAHAMCCFTSSIHRFLLQNQNIVWSLFCTGGPPLSNTHHPLRWISLPFYIVSPRIDTCYYLNSSNKPSNTKKTWKQSRCNLLLQHLQPFILFGVVDGHLVVHKSWHELCLRVKSEFNGNRVEPQNNPNLQLLDVWLVISMVLDFRVHESFEWSLELIAIEACPRCTLLLYPHPSW